MCFTQTKCYKKIKVMMFVMPTIQLCINFGVLHCFLAHLNPYHLFHPLDIKVGGKKRQHETESVCICPASWLMRKCTQHLYIDKKTPLPLPKRCQWFLSHSTHPVLCCPDPAGPIPPQQSTAPLQLLYSPSTQKQIVNGGWTPDVKAGKHNWDHRLPYPSVLATD